MSIATQWMNLSVKADTLAAEVRKMYRTSEKARLALMPEFSRAYGEELSYKLDGSIKGFKVDRAAKSSLKRLLALAFKGKKAKASASTDPIELLVSYITKGEYTKAQCLRAVEAAFRK